MNFLIFALAVGSFTVVAGIVWLAVRISVSDNYALAVTLTVGFAWAVIIKMISNALL